MFWLLGLVLAFAAGGGSTAAVPATLGPTARRVTLQTPPGPGIKLWGDWGDERATWWATYTKSRGCKKFRWGFCAKQYFDHVEAEAKKTGSSGAVAVAKGQDIIMKILRWYSPAGVTIANWIVKNFCLRFVFPLRYYEDVNGGTGYAVHIHTGEGEQLYPPEHPLPPRDGWKRVWVSVGDNWTRNETTVIVFWPAHEEGGPIVKEVVPAKQIRGMLRMDSDVTGALDVNDLQHSNAICGRFAVFPARKKMAMPEFA